MTEHSHSFVTTKIMEGERPIHPAQKVGGPVLICTDPECRLLYFGHWWIDKNSPRRAPEDFDEDFLKTMEVQ